MVRWSSATSRPSKGKVSHVTGHATFIDAERAGAIAAPTDSRHRAETGLDPLLNLRMADAALRSRLGSYFCLQAFSHDARGAVRAWY